MEPTERSPRLSHRGTLVPRLHKVGWLARLLHLDQATSEGNVSGENVAEPHNAQGVPEEKSSLFGVPIGTQAVDQALWEMAGEAMEEQDRRNSIDRPGQVYPPALRVGPQMTQDPRIWADDPRKYLPEGHPGRPAKLNSRNDPEYLRAIESMVAHGIPGRDGR